MELNKNNSKSDCEQFLSELGRYMRPEDRIMVGFAGEATRGVSGSDFWAEPYLPGAALEYKKNMYVSISSAKKTPHAVSGKMRYWRSNDNFSQALAFYIDDIGDGIGAKGDFQLKELLSILKPTAIVETSPNNHQAWYFLSDPCEDRALFKDFLCSFVHFVLEGRGGDVTIRDVMRVGRLPGGINNKRLANGDLKYADDLGRPWRVRLHSADYETRYDIFQIASAFGFSIQRKNIAPKKIPDSEEMHYYQRHLTLFEKLIDRPGLAASWGLIPERGDHIQVNGSGKYRIMCLYGHEHSNGDPRGAYVHGPLSGYDHEFVYSCSHDSCKTARRTGFEFFIDHVTLPYMIHGLNKANELEVKETWYLNTIETQSCE